MSLFDRTHRHIPMLLAAAGLLAVAPGCQRGNTADAVASGDVVAPASGGEETTALQRAPITEEELAVLRSNFNRVHFDFDSSTMDETTRELLAQNAEILVRHPSVVVRIEGHADHFGSDEYNLALGQRRAEVVRSYLTALGVADHRLQLISYGELRPLVGDGDRTTQGPNRRAEFVVIDGADVAFSSY